MPIEPNTGMQLPYKGEPGYEESKAQFPELYAQEEQGMAEGGAPPEAMPGDEGPVDEMPLEGEMPAEGGGPEDQMATIAESAPIPDKPFAMNAVKTLLKEVNTALDKFSGQDIPDIEIDMMSSGAKLEGPLPAELYITLVAIAESLTMLGEDFEKKYSFNPEEILTDADLRKVTATIKKMSKDKKLIEAMQGPVGGEEGMEPESEEPSPPGFFDEDEQALASNME